MMSKDELIKQLQDQVALWRNKYEALAKLYSQLRTEHLDMLSKYKQMQLKANSASEAVDRMEKMERDVKAKNLELAGMIKERDRARFDVDRQKSVSFCHCIDLKIFWLIPDVMIRATKTRSTGCDGSSILQTNGRRMPVIARASKCRR